MKFEDIPVKILETVAAALEDKCPPLSYDGAYPEQALAGLNYMVGRRSVLEDIKNHIKVRKQEGATDGSDK